MSTDTNPKRAAFFRARQSFHSRESNVRAPREIFSAEAKRFAARSHIGVEGQRARSPKSPRALKSPHPVKPERLKLTPPHRREGGRGAHTHAPLARPLFEGAERPTREHSNA